MAAKSESEHILELSTELLEDIELSRLPADKLLLKCSRLARLTGSEECQEWIAFELGGYDAHDSISLKYMSLTGRWTNYAERKGHWGPLAQQEATISALNQQIDNLKLPNISGDKALITTQRILRSMNATTNALSQLSAVRSRVLALLHTFVSDVYYERAFAAMAESIFDRYKAGVDSLIASHSGDVLKKLPSVINRLSEGSEEGISQALTTCRRILEEFADAIYPPTEETIELGNNTLKLDASKHQNRINAFISSKTNSLSRRQRLRQNLSNLFDRVSAAVHDDVTREEAFSLFLNTYLFLGEVLHLGMADEEMSH